MVVSRDAERKVVLIKCGIRGTLNQLEQIVAELGFEPVTTLNYSHLLNMLEAYSRKDVKGILYEIIPSGESLVPGGPRVYPTSLMEGLFKKRGFLPPFVGIYYSTIQNKPLEDDLLKCGVNYCLKFPLGKEDLSKAFENVGLLKK